MFDWLGTLWDSVVETTSTVNWSDVGESAITSSLVGAGVGAIASAVSDGDIGEGLLYGATGGLVAGGLMEFGGQFTDNWTWSGNQTTGAQALDPNGMSMVDSDINTFLEEAGVTPVDAVKSKVVDPVKTESSFFGNLASSAAEKPESWLPYALQIGGSALTGALAGDTAEDKAIALQEQKYADSRADKTEWEDTLNKTKVNRGSFVQSAIGGYLDDVDPNKTQAIA